MSSILHQNRKIWHFRFIGLLSIILYFVLLFGNNSRGDTIICEFVSFRNSLYSTHKKSKFKFICRIICKQIAVNGSRHFCILIVVHLILQTTYVLETRVLLINL